jgi:hypothetical protein
MAGTALAKPAVMMNAPHAHDLSNEESRVEAGGYTCPMHPEVRRDGPGRCPTCGMNLEPVKAGQSWKGRAQIATYVFLAVLAFLLWTEHRAHLLGALPYILVLLCPIMHLFMHRGHGGHAHHSPRGGQS